MSGKTYRLILASRSPRRKEILKRAGFPCTIIPSHSSESFDENLKVNANLKAIALDKNRAVRSSPKLRNHKDFLVLSADTIVFSQGRVLGKPKNSHDAMRMLRLLSGRIHDVKTGIAIFCAAQNKEVTRVITTKVGFRKLSKAEMEWYVSTGEPFDKAGGYAIQGLAQTFINFVDGDFLNVVGLPIFAFREELRKHRWTISARSAAGKYKKSHRKS